MLSELDRRGILHSIASRNDERLALATLVRLGIRDYFLCPKINWSRKSSSITEISRNLNIGLESIAFVDDQPYERDEVADALPSVRCYSPDDLKRVVSLPEFSPRQVTSEARMRRRMYSAQMRRESHESTHQGPKDDFLRGLRMTLTITRATATDLARAEELTVRTHQLNTTGRAYSYAELKKLADSATHLLLVADLEDRYGPYGRIGLAVLHAGPTVWTLKLLLVSCRVLSRGIGGIFLDHLVDLANRAGVRLHAELVPNDKNRLMMVTLRLHGFVPCDRTGKALILESTRKEVKIPSYIALRT
jgi:FkbH-like protein